MNLVVVPLLFFSILSDFLAQAKPVGTDSDDIVTTFRFYGILRCKRKQSKYTFRMVLREIDTFGNDIIDTIGVRTVGDDFDFDLKGKQFGDEFLAKNYTIELVVIHNCYRDGLMRMTTEQWIRPIESGLIEIKADRELTDHAGSIVESYFHV